MMKMMKRMMSRCRMMLTIGQCVFVSQSIKSQYFSLPTESVIYNTRKKRRRRGRKKVEKTSDVNTNKQTSNDDVRVLVGGVRDLFSFFLFFFSSLPLPLSV